MTQHLEANRINKKKKYLIVALCILLFMQITLLWQKYTVLTPPKQINEEYLNQFPQILISLFSPNNLTTWENLNSNHLSILQNWLAIDRIQVALHKNDNQLQVSFQAPLDSKPSMVLNKIKLLPKLTLLSLSVKTIENHREFNLQFAF